MIIVLSGPGGVGKGTVANRLVDGDAQLTLSRSWTTRARRDGEPADWYKFVTREQFLDHQREDGFLEWNEFIGNLYGTPRPDPTMTSDLLLEIDVNGGRQVLNSYPDTRLLFVDAPSLEAQRARLVGRGDPPEKVAQRMAEGEIERGAADELGYRWVVNDDLDRCVTEIRGLLERWRAGLA
jgi:guanylate kinase